jgi:hypothetical protein
MDSISPSIYEPQRLTKPKAHQEAKNILEVLNLGYQQQEYQMIQILRYWDLCAEDMDPRYAGRRSRNQGINSHLIQNNSRSLVYK